MKNSKVYLLMARWKHRFSYNFNLWKTIYVNFVFLPFKQAIYLPIFVYGRVKIYDHSGTIVIEDRIRTGMIHFGRNTDKFSASKGSALINITGKLIFKGTVLFSCDNTLHIVGECIIGKYSFFGNGVKIYCVNKISLGECCRVTLECQIFDTNFHYMRNVETGQIDRRDKMVIVGNYCWVGYRTTLARGTQLPDYSIVSSNSLVNKDFISSDVKYPLLAGIPAKIISSMRVRVFDRIEEEKINHFFINNPTALYYMSGQTGRKDEEKGHEYFFSRL